MQVRKNPEEPGSAKRRPSAASSLARSPDSSDAMQSRAASGPWLSPARALASVACTPRWACRATSWASSLARPTRARSPENRANGGRMPASGRAHDGQVKAGESCWPCSWSATSSPRSRSAATSTTKTRSPPATRPCRRRSEHHRRRDRRRAPGPEVLPVRAADRPGQRGRQTSQTESGLPPPPAYGPRSSSGSAASATSAADCSSRPGCRAWNELAFASADRSSACAGAGKRDVLQPELAACERPAALVGDGDKP